MDTLSWYTVLYKNGGCSGLTSVAIPNSVTSIGYRAFSWCSGLTSVIIGKSVISIGYEAFYRCPIENVYCYAEKVPETDTSAFDEYYAKYAMLHVPEASIDLYKAADQWKDFDTIKAIGDDTPTEEPKDPEVCAIPTLSVVDGKLKFDCETPNASVFYYVKGLSSSQTVKAGESVSPIITIAYYAMAEGYINSEEQIAEIMILDTKLSDETPINSPQMTDEEARAKKFIEAGRLVILSSGKRYGIDGKNIE